MAKVCYNKQYRTEAAGQEQDMHQGVQGGLLQVSFRAAQDVLSLWQQMTGIQEVSLPRKTHSNVKVGGFHGGLVS